MVIWRKGQPVIDSGVVYEVGRKTRVRRVKFKYSGIVGVRDTYGSIGEALREELGGWCRYAGGDFGGPVNRLELERGLLAINRLQRLMDKLYRRNLL